MPLTSDLQLDAAKFQPAAISSQTNAFNEKLMDIMKGGPMWWEVGAEKYRQMRWNGETPLPKPIVLEHAVNITIPSRDSGRDIPCRVLKPTKTEPKGVYYHIHGGGWVLQSEAYQDTMLQYLADHTALTVVSVGYRLAPEDPYPAGNEDCFDVGEWLVDHAHAKFGAPLAFMGGESAGGHLSVVTTFHLLQTRPQHRFKGLLLNFGAFDLAGMLPQAHHFDLPLVLTHQIMAKYFDAYLPNHPTEAQRRHPMISPLYADLNSMTLPPALFTCGTLDPLLDDSILMSAKWTMSGAESILKVYPGAPHGFIMFDTKVGTETVQQGLDDVTTFIGERS